MSNPIFNALVDAFNDPRFQIAANLIPQGVSEGVEGAVGGAQGAAQAAQNFALSQTPVTAIGQTAGKAAQIANDPVVDATVEHLVPGSGPVRSLRFKRNTSASTTPTTQENTSSSAQSTTTPTEQGADTPTTNEESSGTPSNEEGESNTAPSPTTDETKDPTTSTDGQKDREFRMTPEERARRAAAEDTASGNEMVDDSPMTAEDFEKLMPEDKAIVKERKRKILMKERQETQRMEISQRLSQMNVPHDPDADYATLRALLIKEHRKRAKKNTAKPLTDKQKNKMKSGVSRGGRQGISASYAAAEEMAKEYEISRIQSERNISRRAAEAIWMMKNGKAYEKAITSATDNEMQRQRTTEGPYKYTTRGGIHKDTGTEVLNTMLPLD